MEHFIILSITGFFAVVILRRDWPKRSQLFFLFLVFIVVLSILAAIEFELIGTRSISKGGSTSAFSFWIGIGAYLSMVSGMISKYLFDAFGKKKSIRIDKGQLLRPLIVSPIVFGPIYSKMEATASIFLILLFSFQNGFFWQTVFDRKT